MANLKELKNKINVIDSTRKVTSAMKLVAGVKLKKAEQKAMSSRDYAAELAGILSRLRREFLDEKLQIFSGREKIAAEMLIVYSSDRGLCGNFNYLICSNVSRLIAEAHAGGRAVHVICIGSKARPQIKKMINHRDSVKEESGFYKNTDLVQQSMDLARRILEYFSTTVVDKVSLVYMKSSSVLNRKVEVKTIIPIACEPNPDNSMTIFEPSAREVLDELIPYNFAIQIYQAALESVASEQSSRMTSMDNATRNADALLGEFGIKYNRIRQYKITQELTEVISGADAITKG
ncbi:MAG: ATP synthase F1 subunit gamma [Holosporaceae bacterium]|jgi:F-type H+-transporting ATPase subunit gamma|nr:ATP synthase F1 subunit gamma [Holosporaceae bacterium]